MTKSYSLLLFATLGMNIQSDAQSLPHNAWQCTNDSLSYPNKSINHKSYTKNSFKQEFSYLGIPLIASGLIVKEKNKEFRMLRNRFEPNFHKRYDDYTQYVPLVTTWTLKAAGVNGRSNWGELAVSNTFSAIFMAGFVNGLKYTVKEKRPDNTSNNSFPSGHTATAFMCATILHKEYGNISPWYSIGGYTLAGLTGVTRQLNNRHWISDVLTGAGIGILSADLGYFLSDLLMRNKNNHVSFSNAAYNTSGTPSFLAFNLGFASGPSALSTVKLYDTENGSPLNMRLKTGTASVISAEGAWFFSTHWGIGGRIKVSTLPVTADIPQEDMKNFDMDNDRKEGAPVNMFLLNGLESDHLGFLDLDIGAYLSYPIGKNFLIGSKILAGKRINSDFSLNSVCRINPEIFDKQKISEKDYIRFYQNDINYYKETEQLSVKELLNEDFVDEEFLHIRKSATFKLGTGISLTWRYKQDAAFRLYCDYDYASPRLTYDLHNSWVDEAGNRKVQTYSRKTPMHNFTFGSSIAFMF